MKSRNLPTTLLSLAFSFLTASLLAQDTTLDIQWSLSPGDRSYLTDDNRERGLAYNPATGNVIVVQRSGDPTIAVLNGADGEEVGQLSVTGISGGFSDFFLNKIAIADDGTLYGCNMTLDSSSTPFRVYRWADEEAEPELVFEGDPSDGDSVDTNRRFGDSIAIRGTGPETEILLSTWQGAIMSLLQPVDDTSFSATPIPFPEAVQGGDIRNLAFGPDNIVYGSHAGRALHELQLDADEPGLTVLRSFGGAIISSGIGPVAVDVENNLLAGVNTGSHEVMLYNRSHLTTEWTVQPVATRTFPTTHTNTNGTGDVNFAAGNRIFALDTNNGLAALDFDIGEPPAPVEPGELYWSNASAIRTAGLDGTEPRTVLGGLSRPIGVDLDEIGNRVYWAEDSGGRVAGAALDGSDPDILVELPLVSNASGQFLGVNPALEKLYWAEWTRGFFSADPDGENIEHLIDQDSNQTTAVSVHRATGHVYFGSAANGEIWRTDADGGNQVDIAELGTATYGIAVDPDGSRLFYTNFSSGVLGYFDFDTSETTELLTGLGQPLGITVTADGNRLYWVERTGGLIRTAGFDGQGLSDPETLVSGEDSPFGIAVLDVSAGEDFASWMARFDVPEGQDEPGDDPDGDGVPNLLEYALDLSPVATSTGALPAGILEADGDAEYLTLTVQRNPSATGIRLFVEVSSDLVAWHADEEHVTVLIDEPGLLKVRDNTPFPGDNRRFIRLRVVKE